MVMVGEYTSLAFLLPAATLVGYAIGYLLDRAFHTHFLYLVFLILGIAAGFVQLIRQVTRDTRNGE
jgi:ATP synthase protein I